MKFINETPANLPLPMRLGLQSGTVFHYPGSPNLYMKTCEGHVDLANGKTWRDVDVTDSKAVVVEATLTYKDKT